MQNKIAAHVLNSFAITLVMILVVVPYTLNFSASLVGSVLDPEISVFRPFTEEGFRHDQLIASLFIGTFPLLALMLLGIHKKYTRIINPVKFYYSRFFPLLLSFILGTIIYLLFFKAFGGYFFNFQLDTDRMNEVHADYLNPFKYGYFFTSITLFFLIVFSAYKALSSRK